MLRKRKLFSNEQTETHAQPQLNADIEDREKSEWRSDLSVKTSTPKMCKERLVCHRKILDSVSSGIESKSFVVGSADGSFQFADESWMEDIHGHLDEVEEAYKSSGDQMTIPHTKQISAGEMQIKRDTCTISNKECRNDIMDISSVSGNVGLNIFSDDKILTLNKPVHTPLENETSQNQKSNDLSSIERECEVDVQFFESSVINCSDEAGMPKVEKCQKRINNLSSFIKETLRNNAKNTTPVVSHKSLCRDAAMAVALEAASKRREEVSQINSKGPFYGLPSQVKQLFQKHRGIEKLYAWQHECLNLSAIAERKNLIYSLPTSGGKTLVAEILILKELLCKGHNALLIQPYISIVQEKIKALSPFAVELDFLVEEYAGSKGLLPPRQRRKRHTLYVATIEKAHSLINCFLDSKRTNELGLLVVDELHMIGEGGRRGAILETALAKVIHAFKETRVIGMSATIGNMNELQQFLKAENYCGSFRPIELKEYVKVGDEIWSFDPKSNTESYFQYERKLKFHYTPQMRQQDPDLLVGLALEVIPQNSCLIFCPTKKHCENVAKLLSNLLPKKLRLHKSEGKEALYNALSNESAGSICAILSKTLPYGVAYHHSGLTMDERKLIEEGFSIGTLCCLACTSTLAAGVNLPAKRVILRAPYVGTSFLTRSRYNQMVGRAGRAGLDTSGESILILKPEEKQKVQQFLSTPVETCQSSLLFDGGKGLRTLLLNLIGLEIASTCDELKVFVKSTLLAIQTQDKALTSNSIVHDSLLSLKSLGLIKFKNSDDDRILEVTRLGRATFKGSIDIDHSGQVYHQLKHMQKCLALHSHLHLLFLVTPLNQMQISIIPNIYFSAYMALNCDDLHTAELIGVPEACVVHVARGLRTKSTSKEVVNRFYLTLILYDLWQQKTVWEVAEKFHLHRGIVQNLLSNAVSFSTCILHFCQELEELWPYQQILPSFVQQLSYCVTMELIPLMELPSVKRGRARQLYNAGYKTLADIAKANPEELVCNVDHLPRHTAFQIVSVAKMLVFEKAESLAEEAEEMLAKLNENS